MKRRTEISHEFVDSVPDEMQEGILYVSVKFGTAIHKCCCGCGNQVVTPFSPAEWTLIFDGETVSLDPSVGNWSFPCQSHYWIRRNKVVWATRFSRREIERVRASDLNARESYYDGKQAAATEPAAHNPKRHTGPWTRIKRWWSK